MDNLYINPNIQYMCHSNSEYPKLDILYGCSMKNHINLALDTLCLTPNLRKNNYMYLYSYIPIHI